MGAGFILPVERISTTDTSYGYFSQIVLPVEYTVSKYVLDGYISFRRSPRKIRLFSRCFICLSNLFRLNESISELKLIISISPPYTQQTALHDMLDKPQHGSKTVLVVCIRFPYLSSSIYEVLCSYAIAVY